MKIATSKRQLTEMTAMHAAMQQAIAKADATITRTKGLFDMPAKAAPAPTKAEQEKASFTAFVSKHLSHHIKDSANVR